MPARCLHAAAWLFVLLPVGVNASFPTQRQSALSAVHPGRLEDLVRREKGKTQHVTELPVVPGMPSTAAGTSPSCRAPSAAPCTNWKDTCDEALADVKVGRMAHKSKATPWEDRSGRSCLAAPGSLQLHIVPSLPREGRGQGLGPLPRGSCTPLTSGTSSQPAALSRGRSGAARAAGKAVCCLFQHVTLTGRTGPDPCICFLWSLACSYAKRESPCSAIKVLLE